MRAARRAPPPAQAAKEDSDAFLTGLIDQELAQKADGRANQQEAGASGAAAMADESGGGGGGGQEGAAGEPESMELEPCGAKGGPADASPGQGGGALVSVPASFVVHAMYRSTLFVVLFSGSRLF